MTAPWLTVMGIGAEGLPSLSPSARAQLDAAEVVVGGDRHLSMMDISEAERLPWPSPFDDLLGALEARRGKRIVVLATGDPLWFSVGARLARRLPEGSIAFRPQLSAFQLAACAMGWSLADVETLTLHGRPASGIVPALWPGTRLLALTAGAETAGAVARLLTERGMGASELTVLGDLGAETESRTEGTATAWAADDPAAHLPALNVLAITCDGRPERLLSRLPGLPDDAFEHDGKITKREIRALTLARLMPARGELLWDIGTGAGSIAIEWMRAAPNARAIGIERDPARLAAAARNAETLGTPGLDLREGTAPEALGDLPAPDAVFIGGGLSEAVVMAALAALRPHGRLVANAVTLESEALLAQLHAEHGGDLVRLSAARAVPVGGMRGWRAAMPVTQWSLET